MVTKLGSLTKKENRRPQAPKAICGSRATVPQAIIGKIPKQRPRVLSMVGFALEISIAVIAMVTGITWDAATIASNRAGSGFLQLRLKACCCDIRVLRVRRWLKILTPISFPARVRLL